ncbi:MAG: hypothetical protein RJB08_636 [Actinomycetota bacterium]
MALVSFQDRKSFFDELDQFVANGRLSSDEADRLAVAPRVYFPLREVLGYLGGLVVLVGVVWTTTAALQDASPMSIAALLYIAGAVVLACAFFMQSHFIRSSNELGRRAGEVIELLGGAAWVAAVAITLNEQNIRGEHIVLWVAVPGLVYSMLRLERTMFNATLMACAAWIALIAASNSLIDAGDSWTSIVFTLAGLVLIAFALSEPPFAFAPHSVGVVVMLFGSAAMNGADRSSWYTLFPLAVAAALFLYGAASSRIEVLIVSGVATTINVGILSSRAFSSDVVSGLAVTAVGAALIAASIWSVTSSRRSSHSVSSSESFRPSPS